MREVLIIEDNVLKEVRMRSVLGVLPNMNFTVCRSIKAAYPLLEAQDWDLILLDMSFQAVDSGSETKKRPLAGRQILQFMRARALTRPVIVVTQNMIFSDGATIVESITELDVKLKKYFGEIYQSTVFIDLATDTWHRKLIIEAEKAFHGRDV
jgi:CheY-like chemotaxis protein